MKPEECGGVEDGGWAGPAGPKRALARSDRRDLEARATAHGPEVLDDGQALALLCGLDEPAARALLQTFGSLPEVVGAAPADLARVAGGHAAVRLKLAHDLARRMLARPLKVRAVIGSSSSLQAYVLFMVNTGLRPDEGQILEDRDVSIVMDKDTGEQILEIEVRGKRGVGYCKSMPGAVLPYLRQKKRWSLKSTDRVWGKIQRELFNAILREQGLKTDRDGQARTAYSLRHTYISMRLMEGADIYQIAKNCRTSVKMIEDYYASHIKNVLDTAAINRRKPQKPKTARSKARAPAHA